MNNKKRTILDTRSHAPRGNAYVLCDLGVNKVFHAALDKSPHVIIKRQMITMALKHGNQISLLDTVADKQE